MRYIIVLKCQRRDQQRLGPVLHTSETETVHCRECKRRTREKEAAILGCYGCACRPWTACCPWTAWEKAVVSPQMHGFLHVQVCEMCWLSKLLYPDRDTVFHGRDPNFPRLLAKDSIEKRKTDLLSRCLCCHVIFHAWPCSFMFLLHVDFEIFWVRFQILLVWEIFS